MLFFQALHADIFPTPTWPSASHAANNSRNPLAPRLEPRPHTAPQTGMSLSSILLCPPVPNLLASTDNFLSDIPSVPNTLFALPIQDYFAGMWLPGVLSYGWLLALTLLSVGLFHSNIEGRNHFSADLVFARHINAPQQPDMVNGKTGYLLHFLFY